MAFSARDLHRAAAIYDRMLRDHDCGVILCLAGSLISAGLKQVIIDMPARITRKCPAASAQSAARPRLSP